MDYVIPLAPLRSGHAGYKCLEIIALHFHKSSRKKTASPKKDRQPPLHRPCLCESPLHLPFLSSKSFSLGSPIPSSLMANRQSVSGKHGLS